MRLPSYLTLIHQYTGSGSRLDISRLDNSRKDEDLSIHFKDFKDLLRLFKTFQDVSHSTQAFSELSKQ